MKIKNYLMAMGIASMAFSFAACDDDDDNKVIPEGTDDVEIEVDDLDVNADNVENWTKYSSAVVKLLASDASSLNDAWSSSYKDGEAYAVTFKNPGEGKTYTSYANCLEEIIDGCSDIANEVGTSKIGEPRNLWEKGKYTQAVYAVESWYSFHSIDDYTNNIYSIRNAFNGTMDGTEASNSIASFLRENDTELYTKTKAAITLAAASIQGMAAPFRSHIGNAKVLVAMDACESLEKILDQELKTKMINQSEETLQPIVENYVDNVVLPTYANLKTATANLKSKVDALASSPSESTFEAAAEAWIEAREPWETSEAFLFGPVADLGLDPNMDSWPLDVDAIKNILATGDYSAIEWDGDYDEENENIEAAQNIRGFHTLEFLLYKDGNPRVYSAE